MKLVRRARKSIRERRMKTCLNDLTSNLAKVEMKVYKRQKQAKDARRERLGLTPPVPADVLAGKMNLQLYEIEKRLHLEAGLPPPPPYHGYAEDRRRARPMGHRLGFVAFASILDSVRQRNARARS